jgi:hypothetical protein
VLFVQEDFRFLTLDFEIYDLGDLEVETDPPGLAVGVLEGKVLVERASSDQKEVDSDPGNLLIVFFEDDHF